MTSTRSLPVLRNIQYAVGLVLSLSLAPNVSAQVKSEAPAPELTGDKPIPGSHGWANFTTVERDQLNMTDEQLTQLRDMDSKFTSEYNAMGIEPWTNDKFPALNRRRDKAIRGILTPEQYTQWSDPTSRVIPATPVDATPGQ